VPGREKFQIVCGERRWLAASRDRSVRTIRCAVNDDLSEDRALILRLTEAFTLVRLQSLELGGMIARVQELRGCSLRRPARILHASVSDLRGPLAMLRLPPAVQEMVRRGELRQWHAYQISLAPVGDRQAIAEEVVRRGLSKEKTLTLVRRRLAAAGMKSSERRQWYPMSRHRYRVLVTGPSEARGSDLKHALAATLTFLLGSKSWRDTEDEDS
jgi:ParB-like chromosome segregation protein Spo0J